MSAEHPSAKTGRSFVRSSVNIVSSTIRKPKYRPHFCLNNGTQTVKTSRHVSIPQFFSDCSKKLRAYQLEVNSQTDITSLSSWVRMTEVTSFFSLTENTTLSRLVSRFTNIQDCLLVVKTETQMYFQELTVCLDFDQYPLWQQTQSRTCF